MKEHQNTIWSKIKSRVLNYEPDDYSDDDWAEMERLLNENPAKQVWWKLLFTKRTSILLLVTLFTVGVWSLDLFDKMIWQDHANNKTSKTQHVTKNIETKKAIRNNLASDSQKEPSAGETLAKTNIYKDSRENTAIDLNKKQELLVERTSSKPGNRKEIEGGAKEVTGVDGFDLNQEEGLELEKVTSSTMTDLNNQEAKPSLNKGNSMKELLPINSLEFSALTSSSTDYSLFEINTPIGLAQRKWKFGFSLGMTATITDYDSKSFSALPHLGVFVSRTLGEKLELQLEGHYKNVINYNVAQTYEEEVFSSLGKIGEISITNTYKGYTAIEIPLIIKYAANNRLGLLVGGRYSIIRGHTTAESITTGGIEYLGPSIHDRIPQKGFWGNDFGFVLGTEVYLNSKWRLDLRYNQGIRDITPDNLYKDTKTHLNSDLQISLHRVF